MQSCTATQAIQRGNHVKMYLWLTSCARLWCGKEVLLSVNEERSGSGARQCCTCADERRVWRPSRDHSRLQGFFNVSPPRSQKMPWGKFSSRIRTKIKKPLKCTPGKVLLGILWQAHLSPYVFLSNRLWVCFATYTSSKEQPHFKPSRLRWPEKPDGPRQGWVGGQKPLPPPVFPQPLALMPIARQAPGENRGGKTGGEKCQVFLTRPAKSHGESPLVSFGRLLEYIPYLHTGTYTGVYRSNQKKILQKIKTVFLMISSCSSRNCRKITACVPTPVKRLNGLDPACV